MPQSEMITLAHWEGKKKKKNTGPPDQPPGHREMSRCSQWPVRACAQRTERNGGFGFQTKVKDRFLNQRRWTCWYSCRENMQVLSATASLVLLFFLFSFWKACYLCCLPHVMLWRLSLFFYIIIYLIPQCLLNILLCISRYIIQHVMCHMPYLVLFIFVNKCYVS